MYKKCLTKFLCYGIIFTQSIMFSRLTASMTLGVLQTIKQRLGLYPALFYFCNDFINVFLGVWYEYCSSMITH